MSAQEFMRWQVYHAAEKIGPDFDRVRWAQRRADTLNAGRVSKSDKSAYEIADFRIKDPWYVEAPKPQPTFEQIQAQAALMFQAGHG
jgi:hypothetical protein